MSPATRQTVRPAVDPERQICGKCKGEGWTADKFAGLFDIRVKCKECAGEGRKSADGCPIAEAAEPMKAESPKPGSPHPQSPKPESPKSEPPEPESPKPGSPKLESPMPESPKPDSPKVRRAPKRSPNLP